jgi:hypothetical protein
LGSKLDVDYGGFDRRSLFWGAVAAAAVAGVLSERIAPDKNLPLKALRYGSLSMRLFG